MGFSLAISKFQATVLRIAYSLFSVIGGPITGLYTLGVFFPWVTAKVGNLPLTSSYTQKSKRAFLVWLT